MRRLVGAVAIVAVVTLSNAWSMGVVGAQVEVQGFCQSRSDLAAAVAQEDSAAAEEAATSLAASAPVEVQDQATTLTAVVAKRGHEAFATKKGGKAADALDEFVVANCDFPVLGVIGSDYQFEGFSEPLTAGTYVVEFTNNAPAEHHELVLSQVDSGVNFSVKKLLALVGKGSASRLVTAGAAFAQPGDTDTLVVFLEPGRYIYACFIDVGTTSAGEDDAMEGMEGMEGMDSSEHGTGEHGAATKPHWKEGMRGEVEVISGE